MNASCRCDGECMCRKVIRLPLPKSPIDPGVLPYAECQESRCKQFPETCKCRRYPNIAEPGEW